MACTQVWQKTRVCSRHHTQIRADAPNIWPDAITIRRTGQGKPKIKKGDYLEKGQGGLKAYG